MRRLLIAETVQTFAKAVAKQLKEEFSIQSCSDGEAALKAIGRFQPDIILLDLHLPKVDGLDVLRTIRGCHPQVKVIVTSYLCDDWVCKELERLQVSYLLSKPCSVSAVVSRIWDLAQLSEHPDLQEWNEERETNRILLELGFRMGFTRYDCAYYGLLLKYRGVDGGISKCLYPMAAKLCMGNVQQVEKGIRDAIKDAWENGNRSVWEVYFPAGRDGQTHCPTNEVFLARMAYALHQRRQQTALQRRAQ
ncbi:MAG: response regulator [Oscillospiraceae bacterium]|nr:response regulator [Oscillospiraceae bacterium]